MPPPTTQVSTLRRPRRVGNELHDVALVHDGQPQLPLSLLKRLVFPFAFGSCSEALNVVLVCKDALAMLETRDFWAPFVAHVMRSRVRWMTNQGFVVLACAVTTVYQLFPSNMTIVDAVKSKFLFEASPNGFPFALRVVRGSTFVQEDGGVYREVSPSWSGRGALLQRSCLYTTNGVEFSTLNGREHLRVYPSLASIAGWKSSRTSLWYRLGSWEISGPTFMFQGHFSLAIQMAGVLVSVGRGTLTLDGEDLGIFEAFNLGKGAVADCDMTMLAFESVQDPQLCFVLDLTSGILEQTRHGFRLLNQTRKWMQETRPEKRSKEELVISECDFGNWIVQCMCAVAQKVCLRLIIWRTHLVKWE